MTPPLPEFSPQAQEIRDSPGTLPSAPRSPGFPRDSPLRTLLPRDSPLSPSSPETPHISPPGITTHIPPRARPFVTPRTFSPAEHPKRPVYNPLRTPPKFPPIRPTFCAEHPTFCAEPRRTHLPQRSVQAKIHEQPSNLTSGEIYPRTAVHTPISHDIPLPLPPSEVRFPLPPRRRGLPGRPPRAHRVRGLGVTPRRTPRARLAPFGAAVTAPRTPLTPAGRHPHGACAPRHSLSPFFYPLNSASV